LSTANPYFDYLLALGRGEAPPQTAPQTAPLGGSTSTQVPPADDSLSPESKVSGARVLPRNKQAHELSRSVRKEIQALLERHPATAPVLTAKTIQPHLSRQLSLRAIRWHMRAIRQQPPPPSQIGA